MADGPPLWFDQNAPPNVEDFPPNHRGKPQAPGSVGSLRGQWARDIEPNLRDLYLVKGLIPANALVQMYGEPNCGKSAIALDIACHLAANRRFRGMRTCGAAVAYFALEGKKSIENRIIAWCRHYQVDRDEVRVFVVSGTLDLRSRASTDEAIQLLGDAAAETGESFCLIVLDTQARATPGAAENSAEDMSAMIQNCDWMRQATGASVELIHHSGKDTSKGARGHSSQLGAVDVALEVADRQIIVRKARDTAAGESIPFDTVPVHLGDDEDGEPVTAVVAVEAGPRAPKAPKLPKGSETAMQAIQELVSGSARISTATSVAPGGKHLVTIKDWRGRFFQRRGTSADEPASTGRNEWTRAKKGLVDANLVGIWGDDAWIW